LSVTLMRHGLHRLLTLLTLVSLSSSVAAQQTYLIGVTGDGATTPETLFLLDESDASAALLMSLGNGGGGEAIAFNSDDGLLYHVSGFVTGGTPNEPIWESIDFVRRAIETSVQMSGTTDENNSIVYDATTGSFLTGGRGSFEFYEVTPAGVATQIGTLPEAMKGLAFVGTTLYGAASQTPTFYELDPADGSTISSTGVTLGGNPISGTNGLATHPVTGELWGVFRDGSTRILGTIDPGTGVVTSVGTLSDKFAGIAFVREPVLLVGVTGDVATTPETLYALDESDASASLLMALGAGDAGEAIALNSGDRLLYHVSGDNSGNRVWESIDVMRRSIETSVSLSGTVAGEHNTMVYRGSTGEFLVGNTAQNFYEVTPAGFSTSIGTLPESIKGLAFVGSTLYGAATSSSTLYVLNPATGAMVSSTAVTLGGSPLSGMNGLATHPQTGELWGVFRDGGTRSLGTVDPGTGVVTSVGTLPDDFESIAFLPEPSAGSTLASGALLLTALFRTRRRCR
jgi:glutamine cyclotransferase